MSLGSRRKKRLYAHTAGLALAVPQVIAHRLLRMAAASHPLSPRDRREFNRMNSEKAEALAEAWANVAVRGLEVQQKLALSLMRAWLTRTPIVSSHLRRLPGAGLEVLAAGIAPVHKRATANARRLNRAGRKRPHRG